MSTKSDKAPKRERVGQGIKTFHDPDYAEVDILAVPGLGTDPIECWKWLPKDEGKRAEAASRSQKALAGSEKSFNWITDRDGLAALFPRARIMIYDYPSAWRGSHKVRATMRGICTWLLDDLRDNRQGGTAIVRPLIFIAHSMGGVVVAKALHMAKADSNYEALVTCTMGCAFFGSPFRGTNMAKYAMLYSSVFGNEAYETLLSLLRKENNDMLDEVTDNFMDISKKLMPPIDIYCFHEQKPTEITATAEKMLPSLLQQNVLLSGAKKLMEVGLSAVGIGNQIMFVEPESSRLPGAHQNELAATHRDLVKFESVKHENKMFVPVRTALNDMVKSARANARKRTAFLGQKLLTQKFVNQVRHSLEGVDMRAKFRIRSKERQITSWLTSEAMYQQWLTGFNDKNSSSRYLWLKGGPGLGKTNACFAAIQQLHQIQLDDQRIDSGPSRGDTLLAFFLCDSSDGSCTAEDVLKSLITQIIDQEESLAQHAKLFVPNPRYRGPNDNYDQNHDGEASGSGAKATATVDNLWKCLQDMIEDPIVDNIHIVISNIHCLDTSEYSQSTTALLTKLREYAFPKEDQSDGLRRDKWLLTSRNDPDICRHLTASCISLIDLENNKEYGGKVRDARQKHAREAVLQLSSSKKYRPDVAYYVRNSIESQSEDEKWIELVCIMLGAMPVSASFLSVKKLLREIGHQKVHRLVDHAWNTVLRENEDVRLELEEILRALTIAYEPLTIVDLAVLTSIDDTRHLTELVKKCHPVLSIGENPEQRNKVVFTHPEFADRLTTVCHGSKETAGPDKKRYHGQIALICFEHIKESYSFADTEGTLAGIPPRLVRRKTSSVTLDSLANEDDDADGAKLQTTALTCHYPIKYLFRHLSEGFSDVTQDLFEGDPYFWGGKSGVRTSWLKDYETLTSNLKDLNTSGMTAIHVAAAIGANEVVSTLLHKTSLSALSWTTDEGKTALHVAAFNNEPDTVNLLVRQGADIEAGDGEIGTALHFAALRGHCTVMDLLINKGANVNAFSQGIGPVINAAIRSGTVDAVQKIMDRDVRFEFDYTKIDPPLSLSAVFSKPELFKDILVTGRTKWLQNAKLIDQALTAASYGGRLESVQILLDFDHFYTDETMETATLSAAVEKKWPCVNALLEYAIHDKKRKRIRGAKLGDVFYLAATSREDHSDILQKIWSFAGEKIHRDIIDFSLYQATALEKEATVNWLLDTCKADVNTTDTAEPPDRLKVEPENVALVMDFWNPLNAAANSGNVKLIKSLIQYGAQVNGDKIYALQLAAKEGHSVVVDVLLQSGAVVDEVLEDSRELSFTHATALQAACDNNRIAVVEKLLQWKANPNLGGGTFSNPITAASRKEKPDILKLLLNAPGIDVNVIGGEDKSTPLINAASRMSTEIVELLVERGADINATNPTGDTALIMAASRGDRASIEFLCGAGADVTYRSPTRGLPITVAAEGANPFCAQVLAERMGGKIEVYREQVDVDHPRMLAEAQAQLEQRDREIETLESRIAEKEDLLEVAQQENEVFQLQHKSFMSESSFKGQTYISINEQIKAVQLEREELQRQLRTANGQIMLSNDTVAKIQEHLSQERAKNAELRKKQGFVALQEEKERALAEVEELKRVSAVRAEEEQRRQADLEAEIRKLVGEVSEMQEEIEVAQTATRQTETEAKTTAQLLTVSRAETKVKQTENETLKDRIAQMELAAARTQLELVEARSRVRSPKPPEVVQPKEAEESDGRPSEDMVASLPVQSPPMPSSEEVPQSNDSHPGSLRPSVRDGFQSIHGIHREDGSFGGYKNRKPRVARKTTESLYSNSS